MASTPSHDDVMRAQEFLRREVGQVTPADLAAVIADARNAEREKIAVAIFNTAVSPNAPDVPMGERLVVARTLLRVAESLRA